MTALRKALNAEHLPLILGELAENSTASHYMQIERLPDFNRLLHELAAQLPNCGVVNAQGLEMKPDKLHFNAVSLRKLGVRYFEKYKEMTGK